MGRCFVGTSGFSYEDWRGVFYPRELGRGEFLRYYGERFSFVELNFSYYRQPRAEMLERMRVQVPEDFLFSIKAHRSLTHERGQEWEREAELFQRGVEPLMNHDQCAGILLQFPYSFHYTLENRTFLGKLTDKMGDLPLLMEFRNREWDRGSVRDEMRSRLIGMVATDMPKLEGLPDFSGKTTCKTGYLRFHGKNRDNWWKGDNVSRYDYLYSEEELEERLSGLMELKGGSERLFIAFNNHHKGQAVRNAFQLIALLEKTETLKKE